MPLDISHVPADHPALPNLRTFLEECDALGVSDRLTAAKVDGDCIVVTRSEYHELRVSASGFSDNGWGQHYLSASPIMTALDVARVEGCNPTLALRHVEALLAEAGLTRVPGWAGRWTFPPSRVSAVEVREVPSGDIALMLGHLTVHTPDLALMRLVIAKLLADRALSVALEAGEE